MRGLNKMAKKTVCKTCAFTGYRPQKMPWGEDEGSPLCVAFKARLKRALESLIGDGYVTFLSGCARGFDTMAAEAVLELRETYPWIRLEMVSPWDGQANRWSDISNATPGWSRTATCSWRLSTGSLAARP